MKTIKILSAIILIVLFVMGCSKEDPEGKVTFWYNLPGTDATVNVGGKTRYITTYYTTSDPTCGSSGCANFTLPVGSYSYSASSTWNTWSGTVTITKNGCQLVLLQ